MDVTLFEFDIDDASFVAHAPFSGQADDDGASADTDEETGGRGRLVGVLLGLGLLAAIVWFRRNGAPADVSLPDAEEAPLPE